MSVNSFCFTCVGHGRTRADLFKKIPLDMFPFAQRLVIGTVCWISVFHLANKVQAAFGDVAAEYSFPASAFAMSPTQPEMYATIPRQNSIAIINTNTLAAQTYFVGSAPRNLAFSPSGGKLYIANSTTNFVVVFDTHTRTVVGSFFLPEQPQDVVFGTQNRLWVLGESQIFQIDATTGASTGPSITDYSIFDGSLEISPDRDALYYGNYGLSPGTMSKYDVSGITPALLLQTPFGTVGSNGEDLTLSHSGSFICYTTGSGQNTYDIAKFRTSDFASLGSFDTGPYPEALAFSPDDAVVYASVLDGGGIKVFNANTFLYFGTISGPEVATKLAVDFTGRFLFAGYNAFFGLKKTRVYDTGRVVPTGPPIVATRPATSVSDFSASLHGTVNPNGLHTGVHFEYGPTTNYGFSTPTQIYNGAAAQDVVGNLSSLVPGATYHFRIVGRNAVGTTYGADKTFTTRPAPPDVATSPATNVSNFFATLTGTVNPNGFITTVHFEYGTTTNYGSSTATQSYNGITAETVIANLSSLRAGATYHFRIVASNVAGTAYGADGTFTTPAARAVVADFNGDASPDLVVQRTSSHQTAVLYLNNNVVIGAAVGPTLPAGWSLAAAADFDGDGHTDFALVNYATGQTAIVYLSELTVVGAAAGPSLSPGWELVATADFNGDGHPDYVLYKPSTHETAIWYLNNNVFVSATAGPTLPSGWNLAAVADFNGDGHPDYALFNSITGQTVIGYLSGATIIGAAFGPTVPGTWPLVATADFSQDGHPDYLLFNPVARRTVIGYLDNNVFVNAAIGPALPAGWSLVAQ